MTNQPVTFANLKALNNHIQNKKVGVLTVAITPLADYEGIFLNMGIIFDIQKSKYELDLEWIAYGLDLFGENLLENYLYQFKNLEKLVDYLLIKYDIKVTDIPINHRFDDDKYPNPIKNKAQIPIFEAAWQRFQKDFKQQLFLDKSLVLIYSLGK